MTRYVRPAGAALLVGAVHLALASRMSAPIIMADEWGYLGAARRIAGDGGQTHVPYHAGAGLLYLPTTLVADAPIDAYHGALATNAVLAALLTLAAWWVAGLAGPLRPPPVRFAAACAVGPLHVVPRLLQPGGARGRPSRRWSWRWSACSHGRCATGVRRGGRWPEPAAASRGCCTRAAPA